jgi:2-iminobutanoate/2-iminopropanoate deaminase
VATPRAPAAVGPYSQAVWAGGTLYASGQIALDPATGRIVGGDAAGQARQVLENLKAVLEAAGLGMRDVAKVTVYLTDLSSFAAVNEVYATYFPADPPARATVQVSRLPREALVEMDAVAARAEADRPPRS